jgi:hypothetical protein
LPAGTARLLAACAVAGGTGLYVDGVHSNDVGFAQYATNLAVGLSS